MNLQYSVCHKPKAVTYHEPTVIWLFMIGHSLGSTVCVVCRWMVWYGTVRYGMVWYGMVRYGTVRYGMVWYGRCLWSQHPDSVLGCKTFPNIRISSRFKQGGAIVTCDLLLPSTRTAAAMAVV